MKMLLPLILLVVGIGAGLGAGIMLKPDEVSEQQSQTETQSNADETLTDMSSETSDESAAEAQYVELNNQFVIPIVTKDRIDALVVLSLGLEVEPGNTETVYQREPKLRDALLQVLFDHANVGGFRGQFTDSNNMDALRLALKEAAQTVLGRTVRGVVIVHIARQDT